MTVEKYYPFFTFNEARKQLGIKKELLEELIADKVIIVKDLGGRQDFYIDHISFEAYKKVLHNAKKERIRELCVELITKEKKKKLIQLKHSIEAIKSKEELALYGGISNVTSQYLSHEDILHYNDVIKKENKRIKQDKKDLLIAELTNEETNTTIKKLDLSGAKVFGYSKIKEFIQKVRDKLS